MSANHIRLSQEIADSKIAGSNVVDLGYCKLLDPCTVEIDGVSHPFDTPFNARKFILTRFW